MAIATERDGELFTVVIDRPERRNAIDREHAEALAEAFRAFEADEQARVAILFGAHGTFCAGADLKAVSEAEGKANRVLAVGDGPMGPTRMALSKPVIAAIAGHAVAGGLELAVWCDLRVVEESAIFGVFCRRWGVPLVDGGTVRLPRIVGHGQAHRQRLRGVHRPTGWCPTGPPGPQPLRWPARSPPSLSAACARIACLRSSNGTGRFRRGWRASTSWASR